ncbi:uncharacterized protein LOC113300217 isoform X1 [Papaver somniferum]|uniref:uncharacterized protein LOC113300217 isoform X1 n=1 Tax=Papaver somniferum TaxID=3469 RepID=UPI000E703D57|nr:uncharacterized protein LOC113300217 isoform X1 [Papaver somniferum]
MPSDIPFAGAEFAGVAAFGGMSDNEDNSPGYQIGDVPSAGAVNAGIAALGDMPDNEDNSPGYEVSDVTFAGAENAGIAASGLPGDMSDNENHSPGYHVSDVLPAGAEIAGVAAWGNEGDKIAYLDAMGGIVAVNDVADKAEDIANAKDDEARGFAESEGCLSDASSLALQLLGRTTSMKQTLATDYQGQNAMFANGKVPLMEEISSFLVTRKKLLDMHLMEQGTLQGLLVDVLTKSDSHSSDAASFALQLQNRIGLNNPSDPKPCTETTDQRFSFHKSSTITEMTDQRFSFHKSSTIVG